MRPRLVTVLISSLALGTTAIAQDRVRDFDKPILVVDPEGHHAQIRALIATPEGQFLSGGLDKVVRVWDLNADRPRLDRTLRPPAFRGLTGSVYAMALAPSGSKPRRLLAVAGYGVEANAGTIDLFAWPGDRDRGTGDLVAYIRASAVGRTAGHLGAIHGLSFSPDGTLLASSGADGTVRIWEAANQREIAVLKGHVGPVLKVAFLRDGNRLASAGQDGTVRLWDRRRPAAPIAVANPERRNPQDPLGVMINGLALAPDGNSLVIGREDGDLVRYELPSLRGRVLAREDLAIQGIAISPDGRLVASSTIPRLKDATRRPTTQSTISLRQLPDGSEARVLRRIPGLVLALTFRPDGKTVIAAGGDDQALTLLPVEGAGADPNGPIALRGEGTVRDAIGFRRDSKAVAYAPLDANEWEGFDLDARRVVTIPVAQVARKIESWQGWSARPTSQFAYELKGPNVAARPIALDSGLHGRWWAHTFIPPGPGHEAPTLAIACDAGVSIHRLDTGERTRFLTGTLGAVRDIAPSPDGRWLAGGSADQTVRLWPLAGCDRRAPFGATFRQQGADWFVAAVAPNGHADAMGLNPRDRIVEYYVGPPPARPLAQLIARDRGPDSVLPFTRIDMRVERQLRLPFAWSIPQQIDMSTTKRESPALNLFVGRDREWVFWSPRGFYDTSIAGDRKYLGWHVNPPSLAAPRAADFFTIDKFEAELRFPKGRQPNVLDTILAGGAIPAGLVEPTTVVAQNRPPRIELGAGVPAQVAGAIAMIGQALPLRFAVDAGAGGRPVVRYAVKVDSRVVSDDPVPPARTLDRTTNLALPPGPHVVSVTAVNDAGKARTESFEVVVPPAPVPAPRQPRLIALLAGIAAFASSEYPAIPDADRDAQALGKFFGPSLIAPDGIPYPEDRKSVTVLADQGAALASVAKALREWKAMADRGELGEGDTALVALESHIFVGEKGAAMAGGDGIPLAAAAVADALEALSRRGVRVLVLLDGVHASELTGQSGALAEWVRDLQGRRDVITLLASNQGPGRRVPGGGIFALSVAEALDVAAQGRLRSAPDRTATLFDFQDNVRRRVLERTGRRQHIGCYIPETIPVDAPWLRPAK